MGRRRKSSKSLEYEFIKRKPGTCTFTDLLNEWISELSLHLISGIEHATGRTKKFNMPAAQTVLAKLRVIAKKTRGNLSPHEDQLLRQTIREATKLLRTAQK